jgi:cysteine desulfurase
MYFDAAATTPLDPAVKQAMTQWIEGDNFGNENSKHCYGFAAREAMDDYLAQIAGILGVSADQIYVTYSGTDANRRTITAAEKRIARDKMYCSAVEHSSVIDEFSSQKYFDPSNPDSLPEDVQFISLMGANSETGRMYDVQIFRKKFPKTLIHCDASQSFAKGTVPDFESCDFVSFAPQKFYGPKMVGLLYLKNPEVFPEIAKDSHTKSVIQVAGMAKAFELWNQEKTETIKKLGSYQTYIENFIIQKIPDYKIHDQEHTRISGLINVAFKGVRGSELMTILSTEEKIAISTGSACNSDLLSPTQVIRFIEKNPDWQFPIRIGLHKFLTETDVKNFCEILEHYIGELRTRGL